MVKIFSALAEGALLLRENGIDTPRLDCEVLLAHVLGCSRVRLITAGNDNLDDGQYERFIELIKKRAAGMPAAYLIGKKEFMGLDFMVRPGVLIPRGDTETATEKAIEECKKLDREIRVADVCCGSGAIGISIAKYVNNAVVTLIDISDTAVNTAAENMALNNVKDRVKIINGNLLKPVVDEKFDIIVSNPPYIETDEINTLQREVKDFEPRLALDGGVDGLKFYRELTSQAADCLADGGMIIYEIGYNQAESVSAILEQNGFKDIEVLKDLAGYDRCVSGRRP